MCAEGEGETRQKRSAAIAGHPNVDEKGEKMGCRTQGKEDEGEEEKRGAKATRRATATSREEEKIGKRLGRSLRTHPQPESTTLSVPTMKDLPA